MDRSTVWSITSKHLREVEQTEEGDFLAVGCGKDMIGYGKKRGFGGVV